MPEKRENVRIYNGETATFEKPTPADRAKVAEHEAIAAGEPLPSDRTAEELRRLEPGMAEPVITAGPAAGAPAPTPGRGPSA